MEKSSIPKTLLTLLKVYWSDELLLITAQVLTVLPATKFRPRPAPFPRNRFESILNLLFEVPVVTTARPSPVAPVTLLPVIIPVKTLVPPEATSKPRPALPPIETVQFAIVSPTGVPVVLESVTNPPPLTTEHPEIVKFWLAAAVGCSQTLHMVLLVKEQLLTVQVRVPEVLSEANPKEPRLLVLELEIVQVPVASVKLPAEVAFEIATRLIVPLAAPVALMALPAVPVILTSSNLLPELNEMGPVRTGVALLEKPRRTWLVPRLKAVL